jgi:hypothetical protein
MVGPSDYVITVRKPGYNFADISGRLTGNTTLRVDGTGQSYTVTVRTVDGNKQSIPSVLIDFGALGQGVTDARGEISLPATYGTHYTAQAMKSGFSFAQGNISGRVYGNVTRVLVGRTTDP